MEVQVIIINERYKKKIEIFVDSELWRTSSPEILGWKCSFEKCQTLEELEEVFDKLEYKGAKNYAMRSLARRSQSSHALKEKMEQKMVRNETIEKVLAEFIKVGFLNDEEWIASFVRSKKASKWGPQKIAMHLKMKGFSPNEVGKYVEGDGKEEIEALIKTKYRKYNLKDFRERQKVIGALVRKGFNFETVLALLE